MKILTTIHMERHHHELIQSALEGVEILEAHSAEETERIIPEAEILIGGLSPNLYRRAKRLRWVQAWTSHPRNHCRRITRCGECPMS